jgi:hypothetical protein
MCGTSAKRLGSSQSRQPVRFMSNMQLPMFDCILVFFFLNTGENHDDSNDDDDDSNDDDDDDNGDGDDGTSSHSVKSSQPASTTISTHIDPSTLQRDYSQISIS